MPRVQTQKKEPTPAQLAARAAGAERLAAARKRVAPAVIRKETAAPSEQVDAGVMTGDNLTDLLKEPEKLIVPARDFDKEKAENLAFYNEPVTIHIHETAEEQADPRFDIGVNGRNYTFARGSEYTVPRFVVWGLLCAKPVSYLNQEFVKEDGSRSVRWPTKTGLRYGFSVVNDTAKGREWLKWAQQKA